MSAELLPCPFCENQDAVELQKTTNGMMRVHCDNCGGSGYETDERDTAIEFWNRRALPLEPTSVNVPEDVAATIIDYLSPLKKGLEKLQTASHSVVRGEEIARLAAVFAWLEQRPQEPPGAE